MADKKKNDKREDAVENTVSEFDGPFNRVADVAAGPSEGGPVNPVRNAPEGSADAETSGNRFPWEADPTADIDLSSQGAVAQANEARESGSPLNQYVEDRVVPGDHYGSDAPGTGVSAGAGAGTVDT